jgi:hypothetical protein
MCGEGRRRNALGRREDARISAQRPRAVGEAHKLRSFTEERHGHAIGSVRREPFHVAHLAHQIERVERAVGQQFGGPAGQRRRLVFSRDGAVPLMSERVHVRRKIVVATA